MRATRRSRAAKNFADYVRPAPGFIDLTVRQRIRRLFATPFRRVEPGQVSTRGRESLADLARKTWGRRDLNPDQRVSSVAGSDPAAFWNPGLIAPIGHHEVSKPVSNQALTGARYSPRLNYVPTGATKPRGPYERFLLNELTDPAGLPLPHFLFALPAAHPLLAPLPAHLAAFLPRARAPLHSGPPCRRGLPPLIFPARSAGTGRCRQSPTLNEDVLMRGHHAARDDLCLREFEPSGGGTTLMAADSRSPGAFSRPRRS